MRGTLTSLRRSLHQPVLQPARRTIAGRAGWKDSETTLAWQQSRSFQDASSQHPSAATQDEATGKRSSEIWQPLQTLPDEASNYKFDQFPNNEAASFFSELSGILDRPTNGPQAVFGYILNSQYFLQSLEADKLGPPELSILSRAFEHVSLEYERTGKAPKNIWSIRAAKLLQHYHTKGIRLLSTTWATFLASTASRLCRHCFDNPTEHKYQRAHDLYTNVVELDRLVEIWRLFFLAHGAEERDSESGDARPISNDAQQRFFGSLAEWEYGQDLATDQRVFCSALMTSAVLFEHLGNLALLWTRPSKDRPPEKRRLDFSLLDDPELSLVSTLTSAVRGTTPNRMVLRLGLARMSVPSDVSTILLDHIISLIGCEEQVREQVESRRVSQIETSSPQRGLAIRATQQLSRWIERAPRTSLAEMHFVLTGNKHFALTGNKHFRPLISSKRPLLEKMSLRLFQIENDLPHAIWRGFSFNEMLAGEKGTVEKSPALSAIILRALYRKAEIHQSWGVKKFEYEWARLDLSKSRIPNALWWLRFKLLWRAKQYKQAREAYPAAIEDIANRATPERRSAAVLRLTNQTLFLVAQYGNRDLAHARYYLRSLLVKNIEFSAETYRWLIRLYINSGRSWSVPKLLKGYQSRGGKGAQLGREMEMLFASLIRTWPQCSPTAEKEVIYAAIDAALLMRNPDVMRIRSNKSETPSLRGPLTAPLASLDGKSMKDQLVDGLSVTRWEELIETYHQLAKVISDGDCSNKAKLLVTLHEHLYAFVPWQRLPLDMRTMAKELEVVVVEHFNQATPSEQLLLASGRLYWPLANGFLTSDGSAQANFQIMDASLTSRFICTQLEKAKMVHYTRLFRGMRWPIGETSSVWKIIPFGQRALLKRMLLNLQKQAAEMLPSVAQTASVTIYPGKSVHRSQHSLQLEKQSLRAGPGGSARELKRYKKFEAASHGLTALAREGPEIAKVPVIEERVKGLYLPLKEELKLRKGKRGPPIALPERHLRGGAQQASSTTSSSTTPIETTGSRSPYADIEP